MPIEPPDDDPVRRPALTNSIEDATASEGRALSVFAVIAIAAIGWIAKPIAIGILLGTLIAFSLQTVYERMVVRTRRPALTALGFVVVSSLAVLATMGGLSSLLIARGKVVAEVMAEALITSLAPGGALRALAARLSSRLGSLQFRPDDIVAKLRDAAADLPQYAASFATAVATTTYDLLLMLFFAAMTISFILRRWTNLAQHAEEMLPLRPRYTRALLAEFQRAGRATLLGTVVTGLAQGAFAAVGYWVTGIPEPAFFGAATAVLSLLPGVGTLVVWVPAGIYLVINGHPAMGVLELIWGSLVVVGVSDYIIRPRLVGGHGPMPALLTFAALFGGVEVLGLVGLIVGPLIMSLSYAVLRIFAQEARERRATRGTASLPPPAPLNG